MPLAHAWQPGFDNFQKAKDDLKAFQAGVMILESGRGRETGKHIWMLPHALLGYRIVGRRGYVALSPPPPPPLPPSLSSPTRPASSICTVTQSVFLISGGGRPGRSGLDEKLFPGWGEGGLSTAQQSTSMWWYPGQPRKWSYRRSCP